MCTSPIEITRKQPNGQVSIYKVPCGKCAECVSKKHSAFALESVLEARAATSMYFFTLTYNNDSVPIMVRRAVIDEGIFVPQESYWLESGSKYRAMALRCSSPDMTGRLRPVKPLSYVVKYNHPSDSSFSEVYYTPSLRREDVRLWFKRCRVEYQRAFNEDLNFRYAFFGEYGEQTHRPHYHGIVYNLTPKQVEFLKNDWLKRYGFVSFVFVPAFNTDGSPARVKVANYVSKYICKDELYWPIKYGLVERPRRCCSRGFGTKCLTSAQVSQLKNFTNAKI